MNSRERFLEVMNFNTGVRATKGEFGFWGSAIERWYKEGLPKINYPRIPTNISTSHGSLYTAVWTHEWRKNRSMFEKMFLEPEQEIKLPHGCAAVSTGLYYPTQGFALDRDVANYFNFDKIPIVVNVEQLLYPHFEIKVLSEDERYIDYIDIDGATRRYSKEQQVLPAGLDYLVKDWDSWNELKEQRFRLDNIKDRFPSNWKELVHDYKNRDYPLTFGGYPNGIFGSLTHLLGYENLFIYYYYEPALIKDMLDRITDVWIAVWEEVLSYVDVDMANIWEDVSSGTGSMISPATFKEFVSPYYKKITGFLKSKGVNIIFVDTDGQCDELIPLFIEAGVTGLYPMEVSCGMDVVRARKKYPELQLMGGIPKSEIALGKNRIDEFLEPVEWLLKQGGYMPYGDHFVPPEVSWENFKYYRQKLNDIIDNTAKKK
jgi:hypothetical protein